MGRSRRFWVGVQLFGVVALFPLFFMWVPWIAAEPISDVPTSIAAQMPTGCSAVFANHGKYSCFESGLIREHRIRFEVLSLGLVAAWGMIVIPLLRSRGLSMSLGRGAEAERKN